MGPLAFVPEEGTKRPKMTHTYPRHGTLFFGFKMPDQLPKYRCFPAAPVVMVSRIRCSLVS